MSADEMNAPAGEIRITRRAVHQAVLPVSPPIQTYVRSGRGGIQSGGQAGGIVEIVVTIGEDEGATALEAPSITLTLESLACADGSSVSEVDHVSLGVHHWVGPGSRAAAAIEHVIEALVAPIRARIAAAAEED